jgi:hypothetical protein
LTINEVPIHEGYVCPASTRFQVNHHPLSLDVEDPVETGWAAGSKALEVYPGL